MSLRPVQLLSITFALLMLGCEGDRPQSALHPAGPASADIAWLWWFLFGICTGVFVITMALLLFAIIRGRWSGRTKPLGNTFITIAGIILPSIVLIVLVFYSVGVSVVLRQPESDYVIRVTGHRWWWDVQYPTEQIHTANELYIPVGVPVRLELTSADVIHSFWVPQLTAKMDLNPGKINHFWIQADRPGEYRGQCAEFCGLQHALMAFIVVALPPEQYQAWADAASRFPPSPQDPWLAHGQQVFLTAGCAACHAIAGTPAVAREGPDLTLIAARRTLGAGTIPNNRTNLAGWIANPQAIKPGNLMPPTFIEPRDFHALLDYLSTLE
jgi:cytochrome c oxidase subunit II